MIAVDKLRADLFLLVGREHVDDAVDRALRRSVVCSVPNTMWPVSAAVMAASIVSRSRISPTRITSGSCRNARRIASENDGHVDADLALIDRRLLVLVLKLDRVFDRDDVVVDSSR